MTTNVTREPKSVERRAAPHWLAACLALIVTASLGACSTGTQGAAGPAPTSSSAAMISSAPSGSSSSVASPTRSIRTEPSTTAVSATPMPQIPSTPPEPTEQEPTPGEPGVLPTDLSGVVYGYVKTVDLAESTLTFDKVDWFTGADAE